MILYPILESSWFVKFVEETTETVVSVVGISSGCAKDAFAVIAFVSVNSYFFPSDPVNDIFPWFFACDKFSPFKILPHEHTSPKE